MFGKRLGPRPAAHSIFKKPREIDVHACPPLAERIGGGAGAEDAPAGASERVSTKSNRDTEYKATSRAERARLAFTLVIGSSGV